MMKLRLLHTPLGEPRPGDWLDKHSEAGQTFQQYLRSRPVTGQGKRHVLYVQPLGEFTQTQRRIVTLTADFMGRYFNLPVRVRENLPLSGIPPEARRRHPNWGVEQILSTCLLRTVKTAVHETGHIFSMQHCTAYECGMCGSNHREESDRRPVALCPECMAKVCWVTRTGPVERHEKLTEFCRTHGLAAEEEFYRKSLAALRTDKRSPASRPAERPSG